MSAELNNAFAEGDTLVTYLVTQNTFTTAILPLEHAKQNEEEDYSNWLEETNVPEASSSSIALFPLKIKTEVKLELYLEAVLLDSHQNYLLIDSFWMK